MSQQADQATAETEEDRAEVLEVSLLGPLSLTRAGKEIELSGPKRRALLILLTLNQGIALDQETIVESLWPKRRSGREVATLQVHVSHVRGQVELIRSGQPSVIVTRGGGYLLAPEAVDLDIARFDRLTHLGRACLEEDPAESLKLLNEALALWRGRPLQDVEYEEFAQEEIRRLEFSRREAVENRAGALVLLSRDAEAIEDLEPLVRADPTSEGPVRLLMMALYRTGRQTEALAVFRRHSRRLAELGLEPSPRVRRLEEQILQHDPTLLSEGATQPGRIGAGRSVRGYELREEAGRGSVGVVYRAFQSSVGREVAVKVVNAELAGSTEFARRFVEEARLIASLEHPHIVPLYDFWREAAGGFLVMRWMEGGNLGERLNRQWDLDELGRVFEQLAEALEYAHSAGVVHRDVKPANVLFDRPGNAYLCDFALAVTAIDGGGDRGVRGPTSETPRVSTDWMHGEGPTIASDVYELGVLLAEVATGGRFRGVEPPVPDELQEIVQVATARNPADRYPDMGAFRSALHNAVGTKPVPAPRRVRRNPYKGLAPFEAEDRADFYGRDDLIETLLDEVRTKDLIAVIGASGSGKSSLVKAGLIPELRDGVLSGSDEWLIVEMVPGADPFEQFRLALREAAVGYDTSDDCGGWRELRDVLAAALDGPSSRSLLFVDQFEELFSLGVEDATRQRFLENLVELTLDPKHRTKIVLTLRADFSDRPLSHPRLGDLISRGSMLLGPMQVEHVEEVIRRPAARVGIQLEPGLVSEVVRDIISAPAFLPLLQYTLSELFERRREDRLTVQAYRSIGGLNGVLERNAEATYASLGPAQRACQQLFLRMVQVGDFGEETRRRLPLGDLRGLGEPGEVDRCLEAFSAARLITYDRDPVSRSPTVEIAHEALVVHWVRLGVWIDEARSDLLAHRRLAASALTWARLDEDPAYLLTGGPLASAMELATTGRIDLNQLEEMFLKESAQAEARQRRQAEEQRQKAAIAEAQERQSLARSLAMAVVNNLNADPELSLLLAIEGAEVTLDAGEEILPEVVDALHRAVISPLPAIISTEGATLGEGGPLLLAWSGDGSLLAFVNDLGGVTVLDTALGGVLGRIEAELPAVGVAVHPTEKRFLTLHSDGIREWSLFSRECIRVVPSSGAVVGAAYSRDGTQFAFGGVGGIEVVGRDPGTLRVSDAPVSSLSFSPDGHRLVSGGFDGSIRIWDVRSGRSTAEGPVPSAGVPITQVAWAPGDDRVAVVFGGFDLYTFDAVSGERLRTFGSVNVFHTAVDVGPGGAVLASAGYDGLARLFVTGGGGAPILELPHGGVSLRAIAIDPASSLSSTVATLDAEGNVRVWREVNDRSELPARPTGLNYPNVAGSGDRYLFVGYATIGGLTTEQPPVAEVIDAATGNVLLRRPVHEHPLFLDRKAAISSDGEKVAFPGPDFAGDIEVVDVTTGSGTVLRESSAWTTSLAFSEDSRFLAGAGFDGSIHLWDLASGALVEAVQSAELGALADISRHGFIPPKVPETIEDIAFRPGTHRLAWARLDGRVGTWEPGSGEVRSIHVFAHPATTVAFTSAGDILAAADRTGTVLLFDGGTGAVALTPEPVAGLADLTFSPEGQLLAGAGPGPYVSLWNVQTGRLLRRFHGSFGPPSSATFVNGGRHLRVAGFGGFDRGYALDPVELVDIARERRTRDFTDSERSRYLASRPDDRR